MNPFLRVVEALSRHDVRYVIVGGFAAVMHGNNRATADIDLVVDLETHEARKAIEALVSLGMQSRIPVDPLQFGDADQRRRWIDEKHLVVFSMVDPRSELPTVDLLVEYPVEFQGLYDRAKMLTIEDQAVRVCSLDDLIAMKEKADRPQDRLDVENLRALRSGGLDRGKIP